MDYRLEIIRPAYSYSVDDNGTMTIYADNMSVSEISDCGNKSPKELTDLMYEVLSQLGYKV